MTARSKTSVLGRCETVWFVVLVSSHLLVNVVDGWTMNSITTTTASRPNVSSAPRYFSSGLRKNFWKTFSSKQDSDGTSGGGNEPADDDLVQRTSFDQAGRSLIEQEDEKRLRQMGDFDANDDDQDGMDRMRAAIRARAAKMGVEKSKVSADYIAQKNEAAKAAGPGGQTDPSMFGGLDLSKISDTKLKESATKWDNEMPTMFFDPEKELSKEEQEEADPLMTKSILEQYRYEISQAKWPTPFGAIREVALMMVVIALSTVLIVGWDRILREFYTSVGFIPTKEDLANYAARFDGLDLPDGWMNNMNEVDVSQFSEKLSTAPSVTIPPVESGLPEL